MKLLLALVFASITFAQGRMVTQTFTLANTSASKQTFLLLNNPIPGTRARIIVMFKSSQVGQDINISVPPGLLNPKTFTVTVPIYRPFTANDIITAFYWTFDP